MRLLDEDRRDLFARNPREAHAVLVGLSGHARRDDRVAQAGAAVLDVGRLGDELLGVVVRHLRRVDRAAGEDGDGDDRDEQTHGAS